MNNFLHYSPTSRNNAPSVHGTVPFSYLGKMKVTPVKEKFAHPQCPTTIHTYTNARVPGQGHQPVKERNTAVRLRGVSNNPVHHCCDKHPRTQAGVRTCPLQLIINQDVLRQRSQTATLKVNQNITFKTPTLGGKKKVNSQIRGERQMECI